jgi:hypothetical protein
MKKLIVLILALGIIGCGGMAKHREYIKSGILISGLNQFAFIEEWGKPDQQGTWIEEGGSVYASFKAIPFNPRLEAGGKRKVYNDVWAYFKQNKILFFSNYKLIAHYDWDEYQKIERERKELPSIMK